MSRRGVQQCLSLDFIYSKHGGSSRGVRDYVSSDSSSASSPHSLSSLRVSYPHLAINLSPTGSLARHPHIRANYLLPRNERSKLLNTSILSRDNRIELNHSQQQTVKNLSVTDIDRIARELIHRTNRSIPHKWATPDTRSKSIQGDWSFAFQYKPISQQLKQKLQKGNEMLGVSTFSQNK